MVDASCRRCMPHRRMSCPERFIGILMEHISKVLVVDDDSLSLELFCQMLTALGFEPIPAQDGATALRKLANAGPFRFVLTDINMPGIDGWELASRIKSTHPRLPIAAITGEPRETMMGRMSVNGISHALYKPFGLDRLRRSIDGILAAQN